MIHQSWRASPREFQSGPAHLHLPVGVGDRAVLLRPRGSRQHHVGMERGLGEEDVLDDQVLQLREPGAGVGGVRVRHRGVLPHDVHPP